MTTLAPFDIAVHGDTLRAKLRGHWSIPTAAAYIATLQAAAVTVGPPPRWLMDFTDFPVQTSDIAELLAKGVGMAKLSNSPVVAIVGTSALGAMQGRRVAQVGHQPRFATRAEAEAWLAELRLAVPA